MWTVNVGLKYCVISNNDKQIKLGQMLSWGQCIDPHLHQNLFSLYFLH